MRGLGGEQLRAEVTLRGARRTALARLAKFERRMGGCEALMVGWAAKGFFASCL